MSGETRRPKLVTTIADLRSELAHHRASRSLVGFVPTMGALHEGHVRLVERARSAAGVVVVSIYVNPTQFGPNEDFSRYPRTLEADLDACGRGGADLVFAPSDAEMYPNGPLATFVEVPGFSDVLEGASRPGHFRGVATVVAKLFGIVGPDLAFFGEKDFQQLAVIRRMVADLDMPVRVVGVATVRELDGLAMSSRNRYLGPEERRAATVLSRALNIASEAAAAGERSVDRVRHLLTQTLESEQLARTDYAEVVDAETFERLGMLEPGRRAVALLAVRVGPARLIDNAVLPEPGSRCN